MDVGIDEAWKQIVFVGLAIFSLDLGNVSLVNPYGCWKNRFVTRVDEVAGNAKGCHCLPPLALAIQGSISMLFLWHVNECADRYQVLGVYSV